MAESLRLEGINCFRDANDGDRPHGPSNGTQPAVCSGKGDLRSATQIPEHLQYPIREVPSVSLLSPLFRESIPAPAGVQTGRVGSSADVLTPRQGFRRHLRREIVAVIDPVWAAPGDDVTDSVRAPERVTAEAAERLTSFLQPGEIVAGTPDGPAHAAAAPRGPRRPPGAPAGDGVPRDRGPRPARRPATASSTSASAGPASPASRTRSRPSEHAADAAARVGPAARPAAPSARPARDARRQPTSPVELRPPGAAGHRRQHRCCRSWPWSASTRSASTSPAPLYWVLVGVARRHRPDDLGRVLAGPRAAGLPEPPDGPAPRATAVIAAYLPNEADTIVETLRAFLDPGVLRRPADRARLQHPGAACRRGRARAAGRASTPT